MIYHRRWQRFRVIVPLALIVMILMRLVWAQLRTYTVIQDLRTSVALEAAQGRLGVRCEDNLELRRGYYPKLQQRVALNTVLAWMETPGNTLFAWLNCHGDGVDFRQFARFNQWMLVATLIAAVLLTRFITSSYTVGLIVAAMLLSRGRFLADLGRVSSDGLIFFCITAYFACLAHYTRTGSRISLLGAAAVAFICSLFERAGAILCLIMPIALLLGFLYRGALLKPIVQRVRSVNKQLRELYQAVMPPAASSEGGVGPAMPLVKNEIDGVFGRVAYGLRWVLGSDDPLIEVPGKVRINYERGSLFRTIGVPFLLWAYARGRWLRLLAFWGGVALLWGVISFVYFAAILNVDTDTPFTLRDAYRSLAPYWDASLGGSLGIWQEAWSWLSFERVDMHYIASVGIILLCAVQSPTAGLNGFLECAWLTLLGLVLLALASIGLDFIDAVLVHALHREHVREIIFAGVAVRPFLLWMEPVILTMGVAGIYNLLKVFDTRIAKKT